jgi:hypothetical protein
MNPLFTALVVLVVRSVARCAADDLRTKTGHRRSVLALRDQTRSPDQRRRRRRSRRAPLPRRHRSTHRTDHANRRRVLRNGALCPRPPRRHLVAPRGPKHSHPPGRSNLACPASFESGVIESCLRTWSRLRRDIPVHRPCRDSCLGQRSDISDVVLCHRGGQDRSVLLVAGTAPAERFDSHQFT